jgi:hypothetical protein
MSDLASESGGLWVGRHSVIRVCDVSTHDMNIFTHAMAPVVLIRLTVGRNKDWSRRK